ncbi:MAG: hypothetical protein GX781_06485 [Clostridiales bacterium]|nr:hypothetical protein [Clostridiales bacterium]
MQTKRIFLSRGLYIAVTLQLFAYFYPHMDTSMFFYEPLKYFGSADFLYFYLMPRELGLVHVLLPLVAVLPSATFAAEDAHMGFLNYQLYRSGEKKYMRLQIQSALLGSVFASLAGSMLYVAFIALASPMSGDHVLESWRQIIKQSAYAPLLYANGWPIVLDSVFRFALAAAVWSMVGVGLTALTQNAGLGLVLTLAIAYQSNAVLQMNPALIYWSQRSLVAINIAYIDSLWANTIRQLIYFLIGITTALIGLKILMTRR